MRLGYRVAVVGATGLVGRQLVDRLAASRLPVQELRLYASERSAGERLAFRGDGIPVLPLAEADFAGLDLVFSAVDADVARALVPRAVAAGAVVIDKSSAFRLDPEVPLVVPEVNPEAAARHRGILASPNCSTIQLVVLLKPLHEQAGLRRVVVVTFQSVSGSGRRALEGLPAEARQFLDAGEADPRAYPEYGRRVAFNVLPQCDAFADDGYSREEHKLVYETRRILDLPGLAVTATAVRVPVPVGHAEAVLVELERALDAAEARELLRRAPGVVVVDDPATGAYPTPAEVAGRDEVFVGRIRQEHGQPRNLWLWIVADNLRKGAATNAVQIAELLHARQWVRATAV